jgi:glycosyltransferase involved in cell wall biosynthesis
MVAVAAGRLAPEALAWSPSRVAQALAPWQPSLFVTLTARAFHPHLTRLAPVSLDWVDSLAASYAQRSSVAQSRLRGAAYTALGSAHRRVERSIGAALAWQTAAGLADAQALGVEWVPIIGADFRPADPALADHDFVFVGNLGYLPNVQAVRFLADIWPAVLHARPDTTLLLAGRRPTADVVESARQHRWTLVADFEDLHPVLSRGSVALAPIEQQSGISTKVLDAAAAGLPVVATSAALAGLAPVFPAAVADGRQEFMATALELLDDAPRRAALGGEARQVMMRSYSVEAWSPRVRELLDGLG